MPATVTRKVFVDSRQNTASAYDGRMRLAAAIALLVSPLAYADSPAPARSADEALRALVEELPTGRV